MGKLNNILMQLRKNCNHPDLITSEWEESAVFPSADVLVQQCGKMQVLDRLLTRLHAAGHKVLIFSQVPCLSHTSCSELVSHTAAGQLPTHLTGTALEHHWSFCAPRIWDILVRVIASGLR